MMFSVLGAIVIRVGIYSIHPNNSRRPLCLMGKHKENIENKEREAMSPPEAV